MPGRHKEESGGHLRDEARPLTSVGWLYCARLTVGSRLWHKVLLCLTELCVQLHHHRPNVSCLCAHSIRLYDSNLHGHRQYASQPSIKSWTCLSHRLWGMAHGAGEFGCLLNLLNLWTDKFQELGANTHSISCGALTWNVSQVKHCTQIYSGISATILLIQISLSDAHKKWGPSTTLFRCMLCLSSQYLMSMAVQIGKSTSFSCRTKKHF